MKKNLGSIRFYRVAGLTFGVEHLPSDADIDMLGFAPFLLPDLMDENPVFTLRFSSNMEFDYSQSGIHTFDFERMICTFGITKDTCWLTMVGIDERYVLMMPQGGASYQTNILPDKSNIYFFRFMLWTAFGVAALPFSAVAIHASVVRYRDEAILFLGESGTGKSTHTRLWLDNIQGAQLLNDDSPIIRSIEGKPVCFGSPWSGKTPCYINSSIPVKAVVRLSQAPNNRIRKLSVVEALSAIYPSAAPAFAFNDRLSDLTCNILSDIIGSVPFYHLECLPDADAALLVHQTLY